ncbi:GH36-type glycosyl hydrolase domain-containing protein [Bordetella sp. N]|uniref:GH36-type glycosyl hydrolase domain-containing protein n=1 Tax=Bordetella sp. N TaxID=1746199 RepID=UPI00070FEF83|nr:glucoamylase family protein [Bordetella sp. N]ALM83252.1 glycosyl transferase [Bordetella sp. N]
MKDETRVSHSSPWNDSAPVRNELFGVERLAQHARSLAAAQTVTNKPRRVTALRKRLDGNAAVLLAAYRASAQELEDGRSVEPAAEWLLDNYHVVEEQIRQIRDDLPAGFYRQLPKLSSGPFAGYPRVLGVAWAFVAHTDSNFDPEILRRFVSGYQEVQALTIGELWAIAITLRIVLVENLRRLAEEIEAGRSARDGADDLANAMLRSDDDVGGAPNLDALGRSAGPLSETFFAQLSKRLRDRDPHDTPALAWLQTRLAAQGSNTDAVVEQAQQLQGAANVSVRNVISSMRLMSDIDWADWFESVSLADACLRKSSAFAAMDFATRDLYRKEIEHLARGSSISELEIAQRTLDMASGAAQTAPEIERERVGDPGYYLVGGGRRALERQIAYVAPLHLRLDRWAMRGGILGYTGTIVAVALLLLAFSAWIGWRAGGESGRMALFLILAFLPATELATALLNRLITWKLGATVLPAMDLTVDVPEKYRTLVAVPILLTTEAELLEQIEQLEVLYLSGAGGDLVYALLTDGPDAATETLPTDLSVLAAGSAAIARLNLAHGPAPAGNRFLLLNRRRLFNKAEGTWMGWERKRGKLHELNRLLRGATDTSYTAIPGLKQQLPQRVRYVITLDADTRLPRDAAQRLIGKMAHPLNRPRFDATRQRVVEGHAILQPRVTPSLPLNREGSVYQRLFSSPAGMDPYAAAVSDVYQDLFGEGSYAGKGIYDIDAFEAALAGRVPENTMLSHDLFEGVFAGAALVSDIEVVEEFPARYDVAVRRTHRWTRGDWQLLPWIFGWSGRGRAVPAIGRGKMADNLRRSLLAPSSFLALAVAWLLPLPVALLATLFIVLCQAIPAFFSSFSFAAARRSGVALSQRTMLFGQDFVLAGEQILASFILLADTAWRMTDAIVRSLWRLGVSRRHLLEWVTAAQSASIARSGVPGAYRMMWQGVALALCMAGAALWVQPASWGLVGPFLLLWIGAPTYAWWISRARVMQAQLRVAPATDLSLRQTARRTWRFFETFVTSADHMLPCDNYQETPRPVLARRTSPTNMGLYLLSIVAARDFGWIGRRKAVALLEDTLATMRKLERHRGHFLNWYATDDLHVLAPAYVSSVDSGNLAGHLITLRNACEEWAAPSPGLDVRAGLSDTLALAQDALAGMTVVGNEHLRQLAECLDEMDSLLRSALDSTALLPSLGRLATKAAKLARVLVPAEADRPMDDLAFWTGALATAIQEHRQDAEETSEGAEISARLLALARDAREMAVEMDFAFLLDPARKLLSIGYSVADNRLDASCYDLLASEARLASLFAIAKGDVPSRHWLRLGRTSTPVGRGSALISWSGSMFEYLMPSLVMSAPMGSLLEQTNRIVVKRQQRYAAELKLPWGISESAYNARDIEFTYQYFNFGVPGLGLKRGLSENLVVAPYATGLAAMVDPEGARANFAHLAKLGGRGRFGFHEALDFTPSRLREDEGVAVVRSFMAHHQGMTIVGIANALHDGRMRARFHREPMIRACDSLLQERVPRDSIAARPPAEEVRASASWADRSDNGVRRFHQLPAGPPQTHLLSNGRYTVMLTTAGGGYSRWREHAITRWQADPTRDDMGSYIFLRDLRRGTTWSAVPDERDEDGVHHRVEFSEDRADFMRREKSLTTTMQILVSGEHDGEVRRVSLVNSGRRPRDVELTSYAEIVLATPAADRAHPAFSKMFVVTEFLPEFGALLATRRRRSPEEPEIWAAHFAVIEGDAISPVQYETDRARFCDRGASDWRPRRHASVEPLSNTVGTVLDPIFSLRYGVRVAPGQAARISFWTLVADSRGALLDLVDTHHDRSAFARAETLAWTQAQVQLRHLDMRTDEAATFQRLAAPLLYPDSRFRPPSPSIIRGAGSQTELWRYGISGDLPIVLLRIDDAQDTALVGQLLRAHEYWRMKRLAVDLVILNERGSSYVQELQNAIDTAVRSSQSRSNAGAELAKGAVFTLRAELMTMAGRELIQAVARIVLLAVHGSVADQLARIVDASPRARLQSVPLQLPDAGPAGSARPGREFFNGIGGFEWDGEEYVIELQGGRITPAPWINVIANPHFGFQTSAEGSGYTWSINSKENQLTPWSNDPVMDPPGEAFYLRDEASGKVWTPTALPIRNQAPYVARHGFGYSIFEHQYADIASTLIQFVPEQDPIKISRLTLVNQSDHVRKISITGYVEWVLGVSRPVSAPFVITSRDVATGAIFAANPWSVGFAQRTAFVDMRGRQSSFTTDRREFLGDNGDMAAPGALQDGAALSGRCGAALDPCAALQYAMEINPGQSIDIVLFLGQCESADAARELLLHYRQIDLDEVLQDLMAGWRRRLGAVKVKTPDRALDILVNGWLLYQTISCRLWARSAFYQSSGAYGFRDQLQDSMAVTFAMPELGRVQLLRAASRQFVEGDTQHWWLPESGQGVRTRISDDRVWLAYATALYVQHSGDSDVLNEQIPFLQGPALEAGVHDAFFQPALSEESANLFEHCARGLDQCVALTGVHGLPLMGTGDWNDGMNRVGCEGRGESVWLGWLFLLTVDMFEPLARRRDPARAQRWRDHADRVTAAIEEHAWDGAWYRRATFDDGTWLGASSNVECRIDSIAQSWAVLAGAACPDRARAAMASLDRELVRREDGVALLFTPPFDHTRLDPGYIKAYPAGVRENGGQYTHAALWAVLAYTVIGEGDRAAELFAILNPINHARSPQDVSTYKVEPYVVAADVYSVDPHMGRGGWTWYTGSAGWMYRAAVEGILGVTRTGTELTINPCLPSAWEGFEAVVNVGGTILDIRVDNLSGSGHGVVSVCVDDEIQTADAARAVVRLDGRRHRVLVKL